MTQERASERGNWRGGAEPDTDARRFVRSTVVMVAVLAGIFLTRLHGYLLFHSLAEVFSILVAFAIFTLAWNSRTFLDNGYLLLLGVAYLHVGALDFLHTLAYKGMGVFPDHTANLPTQLWIAARYVESLSLLAALLGYRQRFNAYGLMAGYGTVTALVLLSIFVWPVFPDCFVEGEGLTPFKKISEYLISLILAGCFILLTVQRKHFESGIYHVLAASLVLSIGSEMLFTVYIGVYDFPNLLGHLLKIASFYLVYLAVVETGLRRPQEIIFWSVERERSQLHSRVKRRAGLSGAPEMSEETLRRRLAQQHRVILDAAGDGIIGLDAHGRVTFANPRAGAITGWAAEALMGRSIHRILHHSRPDGTPIPDEESAVRQLLGGDSDGWTAHEVFWRRDGTRVDVELTAVPIETPDGRRGAVLTFRDSAARRGDESLAEAEAGATRDALLLSVRALSQISDGSQSGSAGHQVRVAALARAIGTELGLSRDTVTGLYLGAMLHDIGKIHLPAEVLTKPGPLSGVERELIQGHPRLGYEAICDISFPWPVHQMVLQHHERLDGSGYPEGLTDDAIVQEARILAVADVVEAMTAPRPYRAALPLRHALAEIQRLRGICYDGRVVDACVALFDSGRFRFED